MRADEIRAMMPNLNGQLEKYIAEIDAQIMDKAKHNLRLLKVSKGGQWNGDIAKHYRALGYDVTHYVAPWDELKIRW